MTKDRLSEIGRWLGATAILVGAGLAGASAAAPSNVAAWSYEAGHDTGSTVGTAGDFNCDGIADLLLGNEHGSISTFDANAGWVGIWFGAATLPPQPSAPPDWRVYGPGVPFTFDAGAMLGATSAAGDVNRDGCDDVVVSSRQGSGAGANIRAYFGAPGGPSTSPGWLRYLLGSGGEVESIATGDVNGDGTADIIAGIPEASFGESKEGAVLVWLGSQFLSGTTQTLGHDWMAQSNQVEAELGRSVSAGDVNGDGRDDVVAGAPLWDTVAGLAYTDTGRVFMWPGAVLFESTADGTPANAAWSHLIGGNNSQLGYAVAVPGDVDGDGFADIVFGAPTFDNSNLPGTAEGTVLVTRGASPQPTTDFQSWSHFGTAGGSHLGFAVASAGDVNGDGRADYLIGEPGIVTSGRRGRAHLILGRSTASWTTNPVTDVHFTEAGTTASNLVNIRRHYGAKLGTAGDWNDDGYSDIAVSVQRVDADSSTSNGKAFVYLGRGETLASAPLTAIRSGQADAVLGIGLAFAGDINGDGFSDIVGGAPEWEDSGSQAGEGRVFVTYGGPCGPDCTPIFELLFGRDGNQAGANLGWSVSSAGDVNGDGFADVIAGAPLMDSRIPLCVPFSDPSCQLPDAGQARLYLGSSGGLALSDSLRLAGSGQANARFGHTVASAGDVNGDGFGDVIVGAPFANAGFANEGSVFLYLGSPSGLSSTPSWTKSGGQANARFGIDVASAGDVNGDGYSDVIIGADGYNGNLGRAFVYLGGPTTALFPKGLWNNPIATLGPLQPDSSFGLNVATAGDLNRDGFSDVVVGAPTYDSPNPIVFPFLFQTGAVSVYYGTPTGPDVSSPVHLFGEIDPVGNLNRFGSVGAGGDVNGDGFGDLIIGDHWNAGTAGFAQGEAYVFHGSINGINSPNPDQTLRDCPTSFCDFGRDVAGQGDVDGDGFDDVLVAAFGNTGSLSKEGAIFVHLGNDGRAGKPARPMQSLGFGGALLAILGITPNSFDISMDRRTPAGRGRVELEVEVKPLGQNFDGSGLIKTGMIDGLFEPRGTVTKVGNAPNDKFHWRARLRSLSPLFGRGRWISRPENAARELDVRVVPEPGIALAVLVGAAALLLSPARRSAGPRRSSGSFLPRTPASSGCSPRAIR